MQRQSHASSGYWEAEASPCVGPGVRRRLSPGPASTPEEPGLSAEHEAPSFRLRARAQGALRPGWRRRGGQNQPHRELHHQWIPNRICPHSV